MDHFAAFDLPPSPWLEPEVLKEKFLTLSAQLHPDKVSDPSLKQEAGLRFANLNQSYEILRHPRTRLLHFLELQGASAPTHVQEVPVAALDYFNPVATQTSQADLLLKQKSAAQSPMLKVQFFEKALQQTTSIQELQSRLSSRIREVELQIQSTDLAQPDAISRWQSAAAALGFLERWNFQLQQRLAALAF